MRSATSVTTRTKIRCWISSITKVWISGQQGREAEHREQEQRQHDHGLDQAAEGDGVDQLLDGDRRRQAEPADRRRKGDDRPEIRAIRSEQRQQTAEGRRSGVVEWSESVGPEGEPTRAAEAG